ncbi:Protein CBG08306 [Caenorhabditis briggsae]|uniref:Protein CBG08306 n=1 Tax=Caenorhabditis briggsae TaxID=6238 RepID=A8X695_CAEBR|nr:Protein CBG08306 [Caenorhabditis briggsae]CAP28156.1 Protein CBG08306 [Caenorhabditis briggsae]
MKIRITIYKVTAGFFFRQSGCKIPDRSNHVRWQENPCSPRREENSSFRKESDFWISKQKPKETKRIIDWINGRGSSEVEHCDITGEAVQMTNSDLLYILDNVNVTTALNIGCKVQEDFQHDLPKTLKHFYCSYSKWMTLDQLISQNFEFVSVYKSGITNQDMIAYLEKVLAGELPKLNYFQAEIEEWTLTELRIESVLFRRRNLIFVFWSRIRNFFRFSEIIGGKINKKLEKSEKIWKNAENEEINSNSRAFTNRLV